jgi:hypothetical protein
MLLRSVVRKHQNVGGGGGGGGGAVSRGTFPKKRAQCQCNY